MQGTAVKERAAKDNIRRRFDQNQRDCMFTIMSLLPELSEQVLREVDVERLIAELRAINKQPVVDSQSVSEKSETREGSSTDGATERSTSESGVNEDSASRATDVAGPDANHLLDDNSEPAKRTKVDIWEDIKIQSFTRTLIAVYTESLLTMLVHVQLNMIGRSTYLDSVIGKYTGETGDQINLEGRYESFLSIADEQNFLMLSWWFLNRGWRTLMTRVSRATEHCIGQLSLKERLSHRELTSLFNNIHIKLREDGLVQLLPKILLPFGDACIDDYLSANRLTSSQVFTPVFVRLLDQLRDVIESSDFLYVFNCSIDRLTLQLLETLQESFPESVPAPTPSGPLLPTVEGESAPDLDNVVKEFEVYSASSESRVVVVQLLPRIAREGHQILNGVPNQYLENVSASREIQALSAAVYTAENAPI
ncbi:Peroxin-3 [Coemansia reversa NRRL 1564]|uniref:Peroxin-3 n=1 Tax=Coemansia reversa (strain ATCC 12441 / NRRL 1564) TaxID=763665 RepID=A0A2G5BJV0_COERN|nr:Peroxin-3 [Coemansia reversa NRRL 1564]|eukprot:PIA19283.1 Peroxin-3 [Coemansia reversa NRRL 1564]